MTEEAPEELWRAYASSRDPAIRQQIILHYAPLVRFVIGRMGIHAPAILDADDMRSTGTVGLIEAVDRFEPERGIAFQTFAVQRIRGQILDTLRRSDPLSRNARRKVREIEEATAQLERELGGTPADQQVADRLGIPIEDYHRQLSHAHVTMISLDETGDYEFDDDVAPLSERLADPHGLMQPEAETERRDLMRELVDALECISDREKLILQLYYYEELTLREISRVLKVSEARVSQLHGRALLRLRARLRQRQAVLANG